MPSLLKMMAEMGLNISPFQAGLKNAGKAADQTFAGIGNSVKGLIAGYFGFRALESATLNIAKSMAKIKDQSDQFQISTDDVQRLSIAAEDVGLSFEDAATALMKLGAARKAALGGDADKIAAFNKLGAGGLIGTKASDLDLMKSMAESIQGMKMDSETMQMFRELFGKSGSRLIAFLKELNDAKPERLINQEQIDAVDAAEASIKRLGREFKSTLAPGIAHASEALGNFLDNWKKVREQNANESVPWYGKPFKWVAEAMQGADDAMNQPINDMGKGINDPFAKMVKDGLGGAPEKKPEPVDFVSPERIQNLREAQEKLRLEQEKLALGELSKGGQIGALKKKIAEFDKDIATVQEHKVASLENQILKETRIAELKYDQVKYAEQLRALERKSGIGLDTFRKLAFAGGANPSSYAPSAAPVVHPQLTGLGKAMMKNHDVLQLIERGINVGRMFIGGR